MGKEDFYASIATCHPVGSGRIVMSNEDDGGVNTSVYVCIVATESRPISGALSP